MNFILFLGSIFIVIIRASILSIILIGGFWTLVSLWIVPEYVILTVIPLQLVRV